MMNFDQILSGTSQIDDWNNMLLKTKMKEGEDYVLVSSAVWYAFGDT